MERSAVEEGAGLVLPGAENVKLPLLLAGYWTFQLHRLEC